MLSLLQSYLKTNHLLVCQDDSEEDGVYTRKEGYNNIVVQMKHVNNIHSFFNNTKKYTCFVLYIQYNTQTYPLITRFNSFFASNESLLGQVDMAYKTRSGNNTILSDLNIVANIFNIVSPPMNIRPNRAISAVCSSDILGMTVLLDIDW